MVASQDNPFAEVTGADPAAGAEVSDTLTNIEEFLGAEITLVADATVADRDVSFEFQSPTGIVLGFIEFQNSITASQTVTIHIGKWPESSLPSDTATDHYQPTPTDLELYPNCVIVTSTVGLQAGDNFGAMTRAVKSYPVAVNPTP